MREYPPPENPCISPAAPEPESGPVVPLFPRPPNSSVHNSQKRGIRDGIMGRSPMGIEKIVFSDVPWMRGREGWGLGCWQFLMEGFSRYADPAPGSSL